MVHGRAVLIEQYRVDPAHELGPWRLNAWVSLVIFVLAVAVFLWVQWLGPRRRRGQDAQKPPPRMAVPKGRVRSGS